MFITKKFIKNASAVFKFSKHLNYYDVHKEILILSTQLPLNFRKRYFCLAKTEKVLITSSENILGSRNSVTVLNQDVSKDISDESEIHILEKPFSDVTKIEDVSDYAPAIVPSYNFAAYVNDSPLLQEFVKLGVQLHRLEKRKEIAEFILKLNFEKNVKDHLRFLHDNGLEPDAFGEFITLNPLIFKEDLDNLQIRINYLKSKKFNSDMISAIITKSPKWLSFNTNEIDSRLGYFQREFKLKGYEVRDLTVRQPKLITYKPAHVKVNVFSFREEMGFNRDEMKKILLSRPRLFLRSKNHLLDRFHYVHTVMKISHELITDQPDVLSSRLFRIKERHQFLKSLGRAQYNPKEPCYISLKALISGDDAEFCKDVAKTSIQTFNIFQKTL